MQFYIWVFFENLSEQFQFYCTLKTNTHVWSYLSHFFSEREMLQAKLVKKIKTHVLWSIIFFFRKSCRLWHNVAKYCRVEPATDVNIIWRMHIACWITKDTNTQSEYVIHIAFPL
jgi:hypothetical protein